jgi:Tfp pilus assembly protein PilF
MQSAMLHSTLPSLPNMVAVLWPAYYAEDFARHSQYLRAINELQRSHFNLGMTYLEQGDVKAAREQFDEVLKCPAPEEKTPWRLGATNFLKLTSFKTNPKP